jgi:hypothetical protein
MIIFHEHSKSIPDGYRCVTWIPVTKRRFHNSSYSELVETCKPYSPAELIEEHVEKSMHDSAGHCPPSSVFVRIGEPRFFRSVMFVEVYAPRVWKFVDTANSKGIRLG